MKFIYYDIISCFLRLYPYNFMVTLSIVSSHVLLVKGIEIYKYKVEIIANLSTSRTVRDAKSFQGYVGFIRGLFKDLLV